MRRFASFAVPLLFAILFVPGFVVQTAAQQVPTPGHQRLGYWLGEWTYDVGASGGTVEGSWFGDGFLLEWRETNRTASGVITQLLHVLGYSPQEETYTWHRYWSNGTVQYAKGWVSDDTWTFVFDEPAGTRLRLVATEESAQVMRFSWAESVRGGPWEQTSQGVMTKGR